MISLKFLKIAQEDYKKVFFIQKLLVSLGKEFKLFFLIRVIFAAPLKTGYKVGEPGEGFRGKYASNPDPNSTMLGTYQWTWLEKVLSQPAEIRLLCSSVQAIPDEHGSEMWGNFPLEREKLFKLIGKTRAKGLVILSGDRHLAEVMKLPAKSYGINYPIFEITSSSLNAPSGNFSKAGIRFSNEINSYRLGLTYFDTNFGMIEINWSTDSALIRFQVCDEKGGVVLQQKVNLKDLK